MEFKARLLHRTMSDDTALRSGFGARYAVSSVLETGLFVPSDTRLVFEKMGFKAQWNR
jgi:hypothetical protein